MRSPIGDSFWSGIVEVARLSGRLRLSVCNGVCLSVGLCWWIRATRTARCTSLVLRVFSVLLKRR